MAQHCKITPQMGAAVAIPPHGVRGHPDSPTGGKIYLGEYGESLWAKKHALDESLKKAARWISTSKAILIGAGAGMSVDSGLGTYRGASMGVWPPLQALGIDYREICTPDALVEEPQLTWAFWRYCMIAYRMAEPHEGYRILQRWAASAPLGTFCYTTNVDALWPRVFREDCIYEAHGSTAFLQCSDARGSCPDKGATWPCPDNFAEELPLEASREDSVEFSALPRCSACGQLARPNVNMFGDFNFSKKRIRSQRARYKQWLQSVDADLASELRREELAAAEEQEDVSAIPDRTSHEVQRGSYERTPVVCLEIGAGISIPTVRTALESRAALPGHTLIRINPENSALPAELEADGRAVAIPLCGAEALQLIEQRMSASKR